MRIKQLTDIIDQGVSLKLVAEAYTEIASSRLKQIRALVEKNRYFLNELSIVYQTVKKIAVQKKILPIRNNKTLSILLTSNYHFYGDLNARLITFFLDSMKSNPTDQMIIGKTALEWIDTIEYKENYIRLFFDKDYPSNQELNNLVSKTKEYSQVLVFYSEFQSVMVQNPTVRDVTQTKLSVNQTAKADEVFIFEPEMGKILDFFETQVTNLLLQQTFLESELSRTAARIITMDQAQTNADTYITRERQLLNAAKQAIINTKLLETQAVLMSLKSSM